MFTTDPSSALTLAHRRGDELRFAAASERLCSGPSRLNVLAASLRRVADLLFGDRLPVSGEARAPVA